MSDDAPTVEEARVAIDTLAFCRAHRMRDPVAHNPPSVLEMRACAVLDRYFASLAKRLGLDDDGSR